MPDASSTSEAAVAVAAGPRVVGRSLGQANRLIVNTLSNYALTFVTMIATLVMTPIVVKHLGQSGYGMVAIVLAPYGIFETLAGSFGRAMHRFIPLSLADSDPQRLNRTFSTGLCGYILMGVVGAGVLWLLADYLLEGENLRPQLLKDGALAMNVLIVWLVVGFPFWGYRKGLEAIQRFDLLGLSHGIITLLRSALVIAIFWWGYGSVTFFVASQLIGLWLVSLICRHYLKRCLPDLRYSPRLVDKTTMWLMGSYSAATILGTCGEVLGGVGFRIFVGKAIGFHELGELAAVWVLQTTIFRLIDELTNAFAPAISALDAQGSHVNVTKLMISGTKISILVAASMAIVPMPVARPFLTLWLGPAFASRDTLLFILLVVLIPFCLGNTSMHVLYGLGRASITGPIQFFRSLLGLAGAGIYILYLHQGLNGACVIMFGIQALGGVVLFMFGCKATGVPIVKALIRVLFRPITIALVGALATYGMLGLIGNNAWWKITVGVGVGEFVFLILVVFFGVGIEEWQRISTFLVAARSAARRVIGRKTSTTASRNQGPPV